MRISSLQMWQDTVNEHMNLQEQVSQASQQYSSQKVATDLKGYGSNAQVITAYQTSLSQTNAYLDVNTSVSNRLSAQDLSLNQTATAAQNAQQDILTAISSGSAANLQQALNGDFSQALDGLNYQHEGSYLYGGGNDNSPPVNVNSLSQLGALASANAAFSNGTKIKASQLDAHTSMQTGFLASQAGSQIMTAFYQAQQLINTTTFSQPLSSSDIASLQTIANQFSTANTGLNNSVALNGTYQSQVTNIQSSLNGQASSINSQMGNLTNVDLATSMAKLQAAQTSLQASSQMISQMGTDTLLNYLK